MTSVSDTDARRIAAVAQMREIVNQRKAQRVMRDGRWYHPFAPKHGDRSIYNAWGCRCRPCTRANTAYKSGPSRRRDAELIAA